MLEVNNLNCFRSNESILSDLSFSLDRGEVLEIIGTNGSGKTTLLRTLLGLIKESQGEIKWNGNLVTRENQILTSKSFYQGHSLALKGRLTVFENIYLSAHPLNFETDKLMESLERVNLLNKKDVLVSELSVGQKKRVSIAKWLLTDAQLYLIDEPFSALDDQGHKAVEGLIKELINRGCSFLLTGHRKSKEEYGAFHLD